MVSDDDHDMRLLTTPRSRTQTANMKDKIGNKPTGKSCKDYSMGKMEKKSEIHNEEVDRQLHNQHI